MKCPRLVERVYRINKERGYYAHEPAKFSDKLIDFIIYPFERAVEDFKRSYFLKEN